MLILKVVLLFLNLGFIFPSVQNSLFFNNCFFLLVVLLISLLVQILLILFFSCTYNYPLFSFENSNVSFIITFPNMVTQLL